MEIAVHDFKVSADIGINPEEIGRRQRLIVDVVLVVDRVQGDEIAATIDYREIVRAAQELGERRIALIETFALSLARTMLRDIRVHEASVKVVKPEALDNGIASAKISLKRSAL